MFLTCLMSRPFSTKLFMAYLANRSEAVFRPKPQIIIFSWEGTSAFRQYLFIFSFGDSTT
jgi:hypothetical protein